MACADCGSKYPRVNGVVRFVDVEHYIGSFGFQWNIFRQTQLDNEASRRSESDLQRRTRFEPEDLKGKLVLDVGYGMGRFAEVAIRWGPHVVGIDLSLAAEVTAENLKDQQAVFFQADLFELPFAAESFDLIYSIGVLHHTPDCERAFEMLPRLLKPGGRIAIWLYGKYNNWYKMSAVYRKVTRRMSPRLLHKLRHGVIPLCGVQRMLEKTPLVGRPASGALAYMIPMSHNPDPKWRVLDTFDWYSPWYQSEHTYEEVFPWFEDCRLEDLHVGLQPISVTGRKPVVVPATSEQRNPNLEVQRCVE
ncbi:MAG: class I SAM-dependent methyltransferase [Candidatus Sulfotelmatobacter sp.]